MKQERREAKGNNDLLSVVTEPVREKPKPNMPNKYKKRMMMILAPVFAEKVAKLNVLEYVLLRTVH